MLSGDLKWGALRAADVFALPSHQENFGLAVVEALACGVPVLISREVNIWREIVNDNAGLAEADTLAGTLAMLRQWMAMPGDERARRRAAATRCFEARFEIASAAENLLHVLQNGNGGPR
jgi:glycosyltransferase involved in cell wall biosynthesis